MITTITIIPMVMGTTEDRATMITITGGITVTTIIEQEMIITTTN